jgi:hypothetical protein
LSINVNLDGLRLAILHWSYSWVSISNLDGPAFAADLKIGWADFQFQIWMGQLLPIRGERGSTWPRSTWQTLHANSWPQRRVSSREIRGEFSARQILQKSLGGHRGLDAVLVVTVALMPCWWSPWP